MKTKWWKTPGVSAIWTIIRIWLGVQWLTAGWGKITGGFEVNGFLQGAIAKAGGETPIVQGWYAGFLESVVLPNAGLFNVLIPWGEFLVGIGLILGAATIPALIAAAFMNLNFLLAGTISTNPEYLALAVILLFVGVGGYYWGIDRVALPALKEYFINKRNGGTEHKKPVAV
ncbi:DoxX family protein (plasmid) [Niallia sp. XMNu-256]|uniref:DoxX family protein n=1 Tax=Niallia sp. XMNu-256 TaxID=3082444 RepID=UPI0030D5C250